MTEEGLYLLLIVDVPDSDDAVFTAWNHILSIRGNSSAKDFIKVTLMTPVEFLTSKEKLLLRFQVPLDQWAVLAATDDAPVVAGPLHTCNRLLVAFHEMTLRLNHILNAIFFLPRFVTTKLISQW